MQRTTDAIIRKSNVEAEDFEGKIFQRLWSYLAILQGYIFVLDGRLDRPWVYFAFLDRELHGNNDTEKRLRGTWSRHPQCKSRAKPPAMQRLDCPLRKKSPVKTCLLLQDSGIFRGRNPPSRLVKKRFCKQLWYASKLNVCQIAAVENSREDDNKLPAKTRERIFLSIRLQYFFSEFAQLM